jgi:outer membrane protein assembly factor BamB
MGRVILWINVTLLVGLLGYFGYRYLHRAHEQSDPERLARLRDAELAPPEDAGLPGTWPQWRGPRRDGVSTETGLLTRWPKQGPRLVWKAPCGGGFSAPAVAGGKVYTLYQDGANETVGCWDAVTGKVVWKYPYACNYENDYGSGPRATPTVDGDFVYTVGATGLFHCLKAATGEKVWEHDLLKEFQADNLRWGVSFSPLIDGDRIFTNPGGPNGNSLAAFDKRDGKLLWKALDDLAGYSSPVISTAAGVRQVVFFTGKRLVSVSPADGKLYWSYGWETDFDCNIATPIVQGDYVFISSDYDKGCALLEVVKGPSSQLQAHRVYENNRMRNHFSSCVLYKDHLYGFDDAALVCMDFRTGKTLWKERGFQKGSLLVAGGHLIILGEKGRLALAAATPEQYQEQAAFNVSRRQCWTVPVLADGKLYVRDEQEIVCLDLKKP